MYQEVGPFRGEFNALGRLGVAGVGYLNTLPSRPGYILKTDYPAIPLDLTLSLKLPEYRPLAQAVFGKLLRQKPPPPVLLLKDVAQSRNPVLDLEACRIRPERGADTREA